MADKATTALYRLAMIPTFDRETMAEREKPARDNDGTLIIMQGDSEDDDCRRAVLVPRVVRLKRGAPYDTPDPEQEALAIRILGLLNADQARAGGSETPSLPEAVRDYIAAQDEFRRFERENPNNSTKQWDERLYAVEHAETAMRAAMAQVIPE